MDATEGVVARPADLTTDINADGAVADGADVELGALDVGLELLCEEVAQLLDGQPLNVEGAQAGQVDGAVGPDREGAAQLGNVQQLDLQAVARAEDVSVVGDLGPLRCAWGSCSRARLRCNSGPCRTASREQSAGGDGSEGLPQIVVTSAAHEAEIIESKTQSLQQVDAALVGRACALPRSH